MLKSVSRGFLERKEGLEGSGEGSARDSTFPIALHHCIIKVKILHLISLLGAKMRILACARCCKCSAVRRVMMDPAGRLTEASERPDVARTDADIRANC